MPSIHSLTLHSAFTFIIHHEYGNGFQWEREKSSYEHFAGLHFYKGLKRRANEREEGNLTLMEILAETFAVHDSQSDIFVFDKLMTL